MILFIINIILAFAWVLLTRDLTYQAFLEGLIISFIVLYIAKGAFPKSRYFSRIPKTIMFALYFLKELIKANLIVAYDILTPEDKMKPAIIAFPTKCETDFEITMLANLITLTPGTLSIDMSKDKKILFVHCMYVDDAEDFKKEITNGLEKKLLELTR
jgi:multicomponent Na+:H+ antiporter subunit E